MSDLVRVNSGTAVGLPVTLADGSRFIIPATVLINAAGTPISITGGTDLDTQGNVVPTNRGHAFTYDDSGNVKTDTVSDATGTWVRTYIYAGGNMTADSGWVKQ